MRHEWEHVVDEGAIATHRLRVPGGWLYKVCEAENVFSVVFVPLPDDPDEEL